MATLFERNEDRVTGFLKWTDFSHLAYVATATESNGGKIDDF